MLKSLVFTLLCLSFFANAQDSLQVKLSPKRNYDRLLLYKLEGAKQEYISNAKSENGVFLMTFPVGSSTGMYRLFYDIKNQKYLDVLYNNEAISVTFDPLSPFASVVVENSKENKVYMDYQQSFYEVQAAIDSLQLAYFESDTKSKIAENYQKEVKNINKIQDAFEEESKGFLANHYIRSSRTYFASKIIDTPEEFATVSKEHFFDYIDFSDKELKNSTFFIGKAAEYVFYANTAEDEKVDADLKLAAISELMLEVGDNYEVKQGLLHAMLYAFAGQNRIEMVSYITKEYYLKMPLAYQSKEILTYITDLLKAAIGTIAPEIYWESNGVKKKLSDLENSEIYLVVFWSSSCSHCLNDIPKLYEFTEEFEGVEVIAVALEEEGEKTEFDELILTMPNWIHVYCADKWENEFAYNYNINSTPSYFVLDKDKKIIAKLGDLEDFKAMFSKE
ncbi:MAG: thioredoxin family protein [Flavobacteriaceae bacterium]|nr:thioredoxin family protein [Flavobacteriaceae bacterium]